MANFGIPNNNHSQFAVAMSYIKEFESKHVIFGKVLEGMDILRIINLEGSGEGFTARPVVIEDCGELDAVTNERVDGGDVDLNSIDDTAHGVHMLAMPGADDEESRIEDITENGRGQDDGPVLEEQGDGPVLEEQGDGPLLEEQEDGPVLEEQDDGPVLEEQQVDDDDDDGPMLEEQ